MDAVALFEMFTPILTRDSCRHERMPHCKKISFLHECNLSYETFSLVSEVDVFSVFFLYQPNVLHDYKSFKTQWGSKYCEDGYFICSVRYEKHIGSCG